MAQQKESRTRMCLAGRSLSPLQLGFNNLWPRASGLDDKVGPSQGRVGDAPACTGAVCGTTSRRKENRRGESLRPGVAGSRRRPGYARQLKSLHAPTVMYGDCACVTCLVLRRQTKLAHFFDQLHTFDSLAPAPPLPLPAAPPSSVLRRVSSQV